ncbi:hypothetical protein PRUPE_6G084900 [Prunus persica]|uniref:Uncharacterized protein n=1 Tax=Prunus persica TaxID=3760 RepID=M5WFR4_PRUPE|nr:hypothetical protein PRUPE_6G084900 [Prunus persica]
MEEDEGIRFEKLPQQPEVSVASKNKVFLTLDFGFFGQCPTLEFGLTLGFWTAVDPFEHLKAEGCLQCITNRPN